MDNTKRQTFIKIAAEIIREALAKQQAEAKTKEEERGQ